MSRLNRTLNILILSSMSFVLASACGPKKDEGAGLEISGQPGNEILLGPGPMSTCGDRTNSKNSGIPLTHSVNGPVMYFNNFQFRWTSPDTFYLQEMKWTVEGAGIQGGHFQSQVPPDEIEALTGVQGSILLASLGLINSNDPVARGATSKFAPCGLALGGVPLANGTTQSPFRARVTIEAIGTAEDSQGNQRFVRQRFTTGVRFEGI